MLFTGYLDVFSDPFGKASLELLKEYPSPKHVLDAEPLRLAQMISKTSRKNILWAQKKLSTLFEISKLALSMPMDFSILSMKIKFHLDGIESLQNSLEGLVKQLHAMISAEGYPLYMPVLVHSRSVPVTAIGFLQTLSSPKTPLLTACLPIS